MGKKDIEEKLFEDYNDVFADIFNVLLFEGKQVIKPDDLEIPRIDQDLWSLTEVIRSRRGMFPNGGEKTRSGYHFLELRIRLFLIRKCV